MSKTKPLFKKMWMLLAFLFCSVVSANAANITYSLTTHVDGRTMTATADVAAGADLLSSMPQALWRAYCTYSFTNEAGEVITTAPDNGGTVTVDYEFNPPFIMSEEGGDVTYNYLRSYNSGGTSSYYVYYNQVAENEAGHQIIKAITSVPRVGNLGTNVAKKGHREWAFYGDAYDFKIQMNDPDKAANWLVWSSTTRDGAAVTLGTEPEIGWQLYVNKAKNSKFPNGGMVAIGVYGNQNYLLDLMNVSYCVDTRTARSYDWYVFDDKNQLDNTQKKSDLWWFAFFATPANETYPSTDIWHVTYKILQADGKWYKDIVKQKKSSNLTPAFPEEYTQKEDCEYDYFYLDADFKEKCAEGYTMPNNENTVLYIKETMKEVPGVERTFTQGKWMTLVLPDYNLLAQNGIWGRFLDYVAVESHENAEDGYHWSCDLKFEEVGPNDLIPNRPYLFLPEEIEGADDNTRSKVVKFNLNGTPLTVSHVDPNEPDATITMYGTYEDFELVPCEPQEPKGYKYIYFYFGNPAEGEYNFYTVEKNVTIAPTICYFDIKATKNANPTIGGFGAKFSFFEGTNAINNIEGVKTAADKVYNLNGQQVQGNLQKGIYIVNGKKVLVK